MKKILTLSVFVFTALSLSAQSDLILYNFNAIPQSLHTNPAYPQQTKLWIGLPVMSGVNVDYHNSGFAPIDLLERGSNASENIDNIINSLDGNSQLTVNQRIDLLGVGFKVGNGFFSLGATQNVEYRMQYPVDLLKFVNYGNGEYGGEPIDIGAFDFETLVRTNIYAGLQLKFLDDKLSVGTRVKYMIGQQNAHFERLNVTIENPDPHQMNISSDILVKTAGTSALFDGGSVDAMKLALPNNTGIGFDFGFDYKITDRLSVNASILDLGSINWTDNTRDYVSQGEFVYDGIDQDLFGDEDPNKNEESGGFEEVIDSLEAAFQFQEVDGGSFKRTLLKQFYAGVNYKLTPKQTVGFLYHNRMWTGKMYHDFSVNYQARVSRMFQFIASYSVINGTYNNIGAGFDLKLGPLQIYLLSDNVLGALMYENLQSSSLRVGVNFTFYGKKDKGLESPVDVIPAATPEEEDTTEPETEETEESEKTEDTPDPDNN